MSELTSIPNGTDTTLEQAIAREEYERLRDKLVALQSEPQANAQAIDAVINALGLAQRAYQATHGLIGNHRVDNELRAPLTHDTGVGPPADRGTSYKTA